MKQAQQFIQKMKIRRREAGEGLLEKTRVIRRKITSSSGIWDAVETLRTIRYAK